MSSPRKAGSLGCAAHLSLAVGQVWNVEVVCLTWGPLLGLISVSASTLHQETDYQTKPADLISCVHILLGSFILNVCRDEGPAVLFDAINPWSLDSMYGLGCSPAVTQPGQPEIRWWLPSQQWTLCWNINTLCLHARLSVWLTLSWPAPQLHIHCLFFMCVLRLCTARSFTLPPTPYRTAAISETGVNRS